MKNPVKTGRIWNEKLLKKIVNIPHSLSLTIEKAEKAQVYHLKTSTSQVRNIPAQKASATIKVVRVANTTVAEAAATKTVSQPTFANCKIDND